MRSGLPFLPSLSRPLIFQTWPLPLMPFGGSNEAPGCLSGMPNFLNGSGTVPYSLTTQ